MPRGLAAERLIWQANISDPGSSAGGASPAGQQPHGGAGEQALPETSLERQFRTLAPQRKADFPLRAAISVAGYFRSQPESCHSVFGLELRWKSRHAAGAYSKLRDGR